ncbi:hypothetical protein TUMSATVNIG1_61360 (plasmid) [Vibrio nigripulchritudo]|uniref:EAL domain-containing protein n=1 Tax=Vibrio nigripulchritudo TaxID=28173 RepID=UPI0019093B49|nr:EAL domain-containing protein [Vibrio nigripulchritudo]BCL74152.1 hypothetical protein VNTUMSATTG_60890 [Vibrio nigripulchritudo]BDU35527.1 hypothetical protein TUMSATVNIG1_61360 [Vibrio nigripulchritudo]
MPWSKMESVQKLSHACGLHAFVALGTITSLYLINIQHQLNPTYNFLVSTTLASLALYYSYRLSAGVRLLWALYKLKASINNGNIQPYYQIKMSSDGVTAFGCEALARWVDGNNVVPPSHFIPLAKRFGLIGDIDIAIAESAIRDLTEWKIKGGVTDNFVMSFNLERSTLSSNQHMDALFSILDSMTLSTDMIEVEITENSLESFEFKDDLKENLKVLEKIGVALALDDFTTGHSSMSAMLDLKVNTVKLDRSLVKCNESSPYEFNQSVKLLGYLVGLNQELKKTTVLEGVETLEQFRSYKNVGVDVFQGFYFGKPVPANQFLSDLKVTTQIPPETVKARFQEIYDCHQC